MNASNRKRFGYVLFLERLDESLRSKKKAIFRRRKGFNKIGRSKRKKGTRNDRPKEIIVSSVRFFFFFDLTIRTCLAYRKKR